MKISKLLAGSMSIFALAAGLASCSNDTEPNGIENGVAKYDQTHYLSVAVSSPVSASRANFEDGSTNESTVNQLLFVFYDNQGQPTATMQSFDQIDGQFTSDGTTDNVTKMWTSVVPVNMVQGQNMPSYVMCYVNPINIEGLGTRSLQDIQTSTVQAVKGERGFAMCNSVYYAQDPITGLTGPMLATPIEASQLYSTKDAASKAPALDIYVERYAAKIGLTLADNTIADVTVGQDGKGDGVATLKFVPTYWRPNAICETLYPTKAFGTSADATGAFNPLNTPSLETMNGLFNGTTLGTGWNDAANFRCYWACSPSYFAGEYPYVSDDVDDLDGNTGNYSIKYFNYNEIAGNVDGVEGGLAYNNGFSTSNGATALGFFYSRETTTNIKTIRDEETGNPVAAVASAVIVGKYTPAISGTPAEGYDATLSQDGTFYVDGNNDVFYANETNAKKALIARQNVVFTDDKGANPATNLNLFSIAHPSKDVRGDRKVVGRYVTLQLTNITNDDTNPLYFWGTNAAGHNEFIPITNENLTLVNQHLWNMTGNLEVYYQGLSFFNIPIHHLNWDDSKCYKTDETGKLTALYNWNNMPIGALGVVRNHVYNIEVTKITGRATGLRSDLQPIVPPKTDINYYVAARLNILAWKVVPTQKVEL